MRWLALILAVGCAPSSDGDGGASTSMATGTAGEGTSTGASGSSGGSGSAGGDSSTGDPACAPDRMPAQWSEVDSCDAVVGESFCSEGHNHVDVGTVIEYQHNPPHSGPHYPMWATWGEHDTTVERGYWVHNLEHGGIVIAYLCPDGCKSDLDVVRQLLDQRPDSRILVTPDAKLEGPGFAIISWTWVHQVDTPDLDELLCFVDQHFNHAPEDVP